MRRILVLLVSFLIPLFIGAQELNSFESLDNSIQAIVKIVQTKQDDTDLQEQAEYLLKEVNAYKKEQATLPENIRMRRFEGLKQSYLKLKQAYEEKYGASTTQNTFPASLSGYVYSGKVLTSDPSIDKMFDCLCTYTFISDYECRVVSDLTPKEEYRSQVEMLGADKSAYHQENKFRYTYSGGTLKIIGDTGSVLLKDDGRVLSLIDDNGLNGDLKLTDKIAVTSTTTNTLTYDTNSFLKFLKQNGTLTFTYKGTGEKMEGKRTEGLKKFQVELGDFYYDCKLVLRSDYTGIFTYSITPSEQAKQNQSVHLKKYGGNTRHYDYVNELIVTLTNKVFIVEGKWKVVDGEIQFEDRSQFHDFIIRSNDSLIWDFLEPCCINRLK